MSNKVVITTDTGSDLRPENLKKYHIDGMIPFHINLGDKSYKDFYECQPNDLFKFFEESNQVPKTAACSPNDFLEFFEPFAQQGCDIVHIAMNSVFSSSYSNSLIAAKEISEKYGVEVHSVDTYTLTGAQAIMALRAAELRDEGKCAKEIADYIRDMIPHVRTNFLLGGMNYAAKGGRCSMLVAFGANLLKLYPMMHIDEKGIITSAVTVNRTCTVALLESAEVPALDNAGPALTFACADNVNLVACREGVCLDEITDVQTVDGLKAELSEILLGSNTVLLEVTCECHGDVAGLALELFCSGALCALLELELDFTETKLHGVVAVCLDCLLLCDNTGTSFDLLTSCWSCFPRGP